MLTTCDGLQPTGRIPSYTQARASYLCWDRAVWALLSFFHTENTGRQRKLVQETLTSPAAGSGRQHASSQWGGSRAMSVRGDSRTAWGSEPTTLVGGGGASIPTVKDNCNVLNRSLRETQRCERGGDVLTKGISFLPPSPCPCPLPSTPCPLPPALCPLPPAPWILPASATCHDGGYFLHGPLDVAGNGTFPLCRLRHMCHGGAGRSSLQSRPCSSTPQGAEPSLQQYTAGS